MGGNASDTKHTELNVATLNYSYMIKSPYQYYQLAQLDSKDQKQTQQVQLNKIMEQIFEKTLKNDIKNKMVKQDERKEQTKKLKEQLLKKYNVKLLDGKWQDRYSPLYVAACGIKNKIHMMNQKQFRLQWNISKTKSQNKLKLIKQELKNKDKDKGKLTQEQFQKKFDKLIKDIQDFDFLIYQVILRQIYKDPQQIKQLDTNFYKTSQHNTDFRLESKKYKQNRKKKFNKSFLNESSRIDKIINLIKKWDFDLFFLQECNIEFVKQIQSRLKDIRIVKSCKPNSYQLQAQSVILIRQNQTKFPKLFSLLQQNSRFTNNIVNLNNPDAKPQYLTQRQIQSLNLNKNTVIQFLYNIILISTHLSAKRDQNSKQIDLLREKLAFLKSKFPECHIILAGDLNCPSLLTKNIQLKPGSPTSIQQKSQGNKPYQYNLIPKHHSQVTTYKKRTLLQAQFTKANDPSKEIKDYIISDLPIKDGRVMIAKDQEVLFYCDDGQLKADKKLPFLPSDDHPFDHYLLFGKVIVQNMVHVTDFQYKYKYIPETLDDSELKNLQQQMLKQKQIRISKL